MRKPLVRPSSLLAAAALVFISACGIEDQDQGEPRAPALPMTDVAPALEQIVDQLEVAAPEAKAHRCYTTCSSDPGKGWTRTYTVGTCSSDAACSKAAGSFCKGKSSDYRYHNSACTL